VLRRLSNGELDGPSPKVVVLKIGTNNIGVYPAVAAKGVRAIVELIREKHPQTKVLLFGVFPRGAHPDDGGRVSRESSTPSSRSSATGTKSVPSISP